MEALAIGVVNGADNTRQTREMLARDFGIKAAFARVDQLAALTGMSSSAIRTQARSGLFPIPHRRVGKAMLFKVEAVLDWYCRAEQPPTPPPSTNAAMRPLPRAPAAPLTRKDTALRPQERRSVTVEEAARVKQQALERIAARRAPSTRQA